LLLTLGTKFFGPAQQTESRRSISDSVNPAGNPADNSTGAPDAQR